MDWSSSQKDKISLQDIDANTRSDGNQAFKFIGTGGFSQTAGELRYYHADGHTYVEGDVGGDGIGDFVFMINPVVSLAAGDFLL